MQHILICPFGWLGKNIMPLTGPGGGMERQGKRPSGRFGGKGRIEKSGDWKRKG